MANWASLGHLFPGWKPWLSTEAAVSQARGGWARWLGEGTRLYRSWDRYLCSKLFCRVECGLHSLPASGSIGGMSQEESGICLLPSEPEIEGLPRYLWPQEGACAFGGGGSHCDPRLGAVHTAIQCS